MKKMSKKEQLNANGGIKVYMYITYCGGCRFPFFGYTEWAAEAAHGAHLSTKFGKKNCYGKGRSRFQRFVVFES